MHTSSLYETDFYAWTQEQVNLLKARQWEQVDIANLIEEIETLGRKERQEFRTRGTLTPAKKPLAQTYGPRGC